MSDKDIFLAWRVAFDRFVFKGPWPLQNGYYPKSDEIRAKQGIEDIINAIDTGDIKGSAEKGKGRAVLKNKEWFLKMENVASQLNEIRDLVKQHEKLHTSGIDFGVVSKEQTDAKRERIKEITGMIDHKRDEIIETMNEIWKALEISTLIKPSEVRTS